jgi:quercetin dioxygenase-like cupin family protein
MKGNCIMRSTITSTRLRPAPVERFAASQHDFDLKRAALELAAEASVTTRGHRQKTLYRHGRVTIALFLFEPGSSMPTHTAQGAVTINVLEGRLGVSTADEQHDLCAGRLLVLASGVPHDVVARQRTVMLLQVHLDDPANG